MLFFKRIFLLLVIICSQQELLAQLGSTHYIPPVHARVPLDRATIYLSTPNGDAANPITISIQRGNGNVLATRQIWNGNPAFYEVTPSGNSPIALRSFELSTPQVGRGLILEGDALFYTSLRTYTTNHAGHLTAKGDDALGTSFRLGSAPLNQANGAHNFFASVMATEDNTVVTFSDYDSGVVFENGLTPTQTLNAGETLVVSGYSGTTVNSEGFIGARLTATKPIVVNSGNLRGTMPIPAPDTAMSANWSDHMIDQIVDEGSVGFEYLLIRGGGNPAAERPLIIANQDNTEIFINGNAIGVTLNAGEYTLLDDDTLYLPPNMSEVHRNMYISTNDASKTIYVYQFLGGRSGSNSNNNGFPDATGGMNFIPPLSCFFQNDVDLIPSVNEVYPNNTEDFFGNLLITSRVGNTVSVNGTTLPAADALANPGTPDWETYYLENQTGNVSIIADGAIAVGLFGANLFDPNIAESGSVGFGGYYSGFAVTPEDTDTEVCTGGGPINLLDRFDGNPPTGGTWAPVLDSGSDIFDPLTDPISNPSLIYNYTAIGDCDPIDVTITITLIENPQLDPIDNVMACETFMLPAPTTLSGNFLNAPQYFSAPQSDPSVTVLDWTTPITTDTTVFVFDENMADPENCIVEISFTVTISDEAIANAVPDYRLCDDVLNDGIAMFDLVTTTQAAVLGTQSAADFTVTWHPTQQEALDNMNPIPNPAAFDSGTTTIHARIQNNANAVCFNTTSINLFVDAQPTANSVADTVICDDSSSDGTELFDLTTFNTTIYSGQSTLTFNLDYYDTLADAESGMNMITNTTTFSVTGMITVFARLENQSNETCFDITEINISVIPQATATDPDTFFVCDNLLDGSDTNGFTSFDFTQLDALILDGQDPTVFEVTYHDNPGEATTGMNPLSSPFINTTINGQAITARVSLIGGTDCFAIVTFDIVVATLPVILTSPILLTQCDLDNNGVTTFNLRQAEQLISANFPVEDFVYIDPSGAQIPDPINYTNTNVSETIDVIVSTIHGCTRSAQITLEVGPSSIPTGISNFPECDTDNDGITIFDFSSTEAQFEALYAQNVLITYYETELEALTETNPIADISAYENNLTETDPVTGIQEIWVRVDGEVANDCQGLGIHVSLTVVPNPDVIDDITPLEVCSPIANAGTFDLTVKDLEITGGNPDYTVTYYSSIANYTATPPVPIATPMAFMNTANPQTIFYSLTDVNGCTTFDLINLEQDFVVQVNQNPVLVAPSDLEVCDDATTDGFTTMDLSVKDIEITGGFDANLTITYHLDFAGATAGDSSIPDKTMFINTVNPQIVVARVTDNTTGCFSTQNLRVEVFPIPTPATPAAYEVCDPDNDGIFDSFELATRNNEITGGDPLLSVAYYLTQNDAENAPVGLEIDQAMYINNDPFTQTIFARVFSGVGCFAVVPLELIVLNTPMPNEMPLPFALCDTNSDTLEIFDLTTWEPEILGGLDAMVFSVTWFSSLVAAQNGTPVIATPGAYTSNTASVFAVVTNTTQSTTLFCTAIVELSLIVNPLPVPIQPAEYELCDDIESGSDIDEFSTFDLRSRDDEITGGNNDWIVSYYPTQAEADAGVDTTQLPDMYQNVVMANETVFVRVEDTVTGCFDTITLTLVVNPLPSPTTIAAVEECDVMQNDGDPDNDGDALFDLTTTVTTDIINGEAFVALTFHETEAAAELGSPLIADPANYETGSRTLWVRAVDTDPATSTACFRVVPLELVVNDAPALPATIPDLTECDTDGNGEELFTLSQNDATILGTLDPLNFALSYHETLISAESAVGSANDMPIGDPNNYLANTPVTPIFVRLIDNTTGCASVGTFNLNITPIPTITSPAILEACDSAGGVLGTETDGITSFDLTALDATITGGDMTLTVTYYESQADLDAGISSAIPAPAAYVNNGMVPQTIFILVSSDQAGMCAAQTTVNLQVNPLPFIAEPLPPASACDEDNDGFGTFDLQTYATDLLVTLVNIELRFYDTLDNATADTGVGEIDIAIPFTNIAGMTMLYVVAADTDATTATACTKIYEIALLVFEIPEIPAVLPILEECDQDGDGMEIIDLTQNETIIYGTQDPTLLTLTYHNSEADAIAGTPVIVDPANYLATAQAPNEVIWVRLVVMDGTANTCTAISSFEISVVGPPVITVTPADLELVLCDDDTDEIALFDLTVTNGPLTGMDPLLTVTYYASLADLTSDTPIADPTVFTNTINPQTIQVVVSNNAGCTAMTTFDVNVLPLPTPNTNPDPVAVCDAITDIDTDGDGIIDVGSGLDTDGFEVFTDAQLQIAVAQIANGEPVSILVFTDFAQADTDTPDLTQTIDLTDGLDDFINTTAGSQTLYARVERDLQPSDPVGSPLCYVVVPFQVVVEPLPILASFEDPYTFCEEFDGDDTQGQIDLATFADEVGFLAPPQTTSDFLITYHLTQAQAEAGGGSLGNGTYTVMEDPVTGVETLFVRIENSATGCVRTTQVSIIVESRPEVMDAAEDLVVCTDMVAPNEFPTQGTGTFDLTTNTSLITAGAAGVDVTYYTTLADATMMVNAIATPATFINTTNPQTIFYRGVTTASLCESTDIFDFEISVRDLPFAVLDETTGTICVDENTGAALDPFEIDGTVETALAGVAYSYRWTRDGILISQSAIATVDAAGTYDLTVTATYPDGTQCEYFAQAIYEAQSAPVFEAVVLESSFNSSGLYTVEVVNITGFGAGPYEFALDDGPFQSDIIFTNVTPGTHTIFGRLASGECTSSEFEIGIIDYPRFFTPNTDGFHDTWNIIGLGIEPNLDAKIFIFDRYGKLLKQISPVGAGWDGTFNGQPMPSNDYWFRVEFTEPDEFGTQRTVNGHFTLKR